jgi:peroxiredoxin Q/BCP
MHTLLPLVLLLAPPANARLEPGAVAPGFSLEASTGGKVQLADYKGKTVVLAFFPKAFTGG